MCSAVLCHSVMPGFLRPHALLPIRLLCPWEFSRQEYWNGLPGPPPRDLLNPRIESRSPTFQADSLPSKPPGKPKNTGVSSLFLLQGIFLTQELQGCLALQVDSLPAELPGKPLTVLVFCWRTILYFACLWFLSLPPLICVTLGKLLNFPSQLPHL